MFHPPLSLSVCVWLQARSGVGSTVDVLTLFASYSTETSYTVWESLVGLATDLHVQHVYGAPWQFILIGFHNLPVLKIKFHEYLAL